MHRWPFWVAIAVVMTVFLGLAALGVVGRLVPGIAKQSLAITPAPPGSIVDLRGWAGFPAAVLRLRLYDLEREEVVWDLETDGEPARVAQLALQPGANPALPVAWRKWRFTVSVPEDQDSFELAAGGEYEVRVWSVVEGRRVERSARFVLGGAAAGDGSP